MSYKTILYEKNEHLARIIVNRPGVLNAQSRLMLEELCEAFKQADEDDDVRVIVVSARGPHFSAGHDMGSKEEMEDRERRGFSKNIEEQVKRATTLFLEATLSWRNVSKPTIAMVQGYCIMGGLMLASACDIIIAAEDAKFTDRAVRQGAPHVQYLSLPWDIGVRKAKELIFTGDFMDAQTALQSGLVNRVVPLNRLEQETLELAKRIALQDTFAVRLAKASLNATQDIMGFTNAINSAFKSHQLASVRRSTEGRRISRKPDESVAEWVARRDSEFGDHH